MKIDIIIPNYNGSNLLKKNLPKVFAATKNYDSRIIVVDDGSKEEDRKNLRVVISDFKKNNKNIELIEHKSNKGFSSAVNTGVKNSSADVVVLMNSDVIPNEDFMKDPVERIRNDEMLFGVGCLDESIEERKIVLRGAGKARWEKGLLHHSEGDINFEETFWISGGSSFFVRSVYQKLGGMDEIYNPFYWEDIDLSYRAQKAGYKIIFDKKSIVKHLHEEGAIKTNFKKKKVITIAYRNQFIFIWKNITDFNLIFNHLVFLPTNFLGALKREDMEFIKGFFLAVAKLPVIIGKRNSQKKYYQKKDREILDLFK